MMLGNQICGRHGPVGNNYVEENESRPGMIRRFAPDAAIIAAITIAIGLISQQWAGLDTPDSSFYFSLANFGSQITDRAPIDSYYWTRLGVIGPTYAFTQLFGPWIGYFLWRLTLLAIIITSFYIAARKFHAPRSQAAMLTGTLTASTVILSYLSNPYVTATSLAAISISICSALFRGKTAALVAGAALGWLAMTNPYAALLAGSLWLATSLQRSLANKASQGISHLITQCALAALAALATFGAFLLIGAQLFPGMNWLQTYLEWNAKLDYSNFSSQSPVWLSDPSLLVPVCAFIVIAFNWWKHKTPQTQAALTIALTTLGVSFSFLPAMAGITLQATFYTAMLWIPMSLAMALAFSRHFPAPVWITPIALTIVIGAGFQAIHFNGYVAAAIAVVATAFLIAFKNGKLLLVAFVVFLASAQLIQNSRGQIGVFYSSPFVWAFHSNPIKLKLANSLNAQEWLIANTTPQDQILTYVDGDWLAGDRNLYVAAGMQFWGENRISVTRELRSEDFKRIKEIQPTVFALYGPNIERLQQYANALPNGNQLGPLTCFDFNWPTIQDGALLCLAR
jgi:hypothetical protein